MSEQDTPQGRRNRARRQLLKGVVAGGGAFTVAKALPENWVAPVVEAVTLPAHAQTTAEGFTVQGLSPFQSGPQSTGMFDGLRDSGERYASRDAGADELDWDTLSDAQILDFFVSPAHAGGGHDGGDVVVEYEMFAEAKKGSGNLCVEGSAFVPNFFNIGLFGAFLLDSPATQNKIKGGPVADVGNVLIEDFEFGDFNLDGQKLKGSFRFTFLNVASETNVSVVMTPGGPGCVGG
jgi:hypothetical protein